MKLIIRKDGQFFKEVDFSGSELIIGRSNEAGVQLLHEDISRKHVRVTQGANKITIEDLGSKNGTMVQGSPIQKSVIQEGAIFTIGPFSISIESVAPQAQRTVVEHSLDENSTRSFNDNTHTSRSAIRPDAFPSLRNQPENDSPEESNSDSFLDAIAVSKKKAIEKEDDIESEAFIPAEEEVPQDSEPVIEYSKPTDPYKIIPEYLEEAEKKKKKSNKKEVDISDSEPVVEYSKPTDPYKSIPEYLKEAEKKKSKTQKKKPAVDDDEYKTTPYQSFSRELDEEEIEKDEPDEAQIKTQVKHPESTMERSLKDFPSLTEEDVEDSSGGEEFFLNREIDEEGIKQTFEDFPDTNKVKAAQDAAESSFSMAAEGEIESEEQHVPTDPIERFKELPEEDHGSDAIPTESFSSPETEISPPDEDHIKTFMFDSKDLPSDLSEKTDEFSSPPKEKKSILVALVAKAGFVKPALQKILQDPKKKKIAFIASALVVGLMMLFMMEGGLVFKSEPVDPELAIKSEETFENLSRSEKKRVVAFQIDQIKKLINNKEVEEADSRMKKLVVLAANNESFVQFEKEYQKQRDLIIAEETRKQKEAQEKLALKEASLADASKMIDNKQYEMAKKTYMRILENYPDDPDVQEKIQTLELLQEQDDRKSFAKKQRYDMLNRIYSEGIQKYESGQVGQAQKLLKQVAAEKGHPKYKKANEYLSQISANTDKKINQRITAAKTMIQSPDTLVAGYNELKKIVSQFPLRSDAKKLMSDAKVKMDKKARELYADALAQEELAGDPAAALDLYREVLRYAPDKSNKYHQKAQEKIGTLQL
jgi:hypothetical protein